MPYREEIERRTWTATVTRLNQYVRESLRGDSLLRSVILVGEVSGFKPYRGGQWYFDLKDETSVINCVMFGDGVRSASFMPRNGDQVRLHGRVDLYLASGRYQFVADSIRPEGVGTLYQRFEAELLVALVKTSVYIVTFVPLLSSPSESELVVAFFLRLTSLSLTLPEPVRDAASAVKAGALSTGRAVNIIAAASMSVTVFLNMLRFLIMMIPILFYQMRTDRRCCFLRRPVFVH